jgi:hypothetical protein
MSAEVSVERQASTPRVVVLTEQTITNNVLMPANLTGAKIGLNFGPSVLTGVEDPAPGLVGRCFLRVCLWVDVMTSWSRRSHYFPVPTPKVAAPDDQA